MKKKLLSILLILAFCLTLLPAAALAADPETYPVWIAGTQITSDNLSGEGWSYAPSTCTLTLTNAAINGDTSYDGIYAKGVDLTIVGTGSVTGKRGVSVEADGDKGGNLTISGDANADAPTTVLTVTSTVSGDDGIHGDVAVTVKNSKVTVAYAGDDGIYAGTGDVVVENSTLDITADYGLYASAGDVIVKGSTLDITAEYGIYCDCGSVAVKGSSLTVTATSEYDEVYGICADCGVYFDSCPKVSVTAKSGDDYAYGIYTYEDVVEIANCPDFTVNATGDYYTYGIYNYDGYDEDDEYYAGVRVLDSKVTVTATDEYEYAYGIYAYDGSVVLGNSKLDLTATSEDDAYGVYGYYGVYIFDCPMVSVTATSNDYYAYGIYTYYDVIEISDCPDFTVNATGDCSTYGIYNYDGYDEDDEYYASIRILDSKVTVNATDEYDYAYGIKAYEGSVVLGGSELDLTATGDYYAYGVYGYYGVYIDSCPKVSVTAESGDYYACGIYAEYYVIEISDCPDFTVKATGYEYGYGIYNYDGYDYYDTEYYAAVRILDSNVTVTATGEDDDAYGIYADCGAVVLDGSRLDLTATCGDDVYGGIYSDYGVYIFDCPDVSVTTYGECCSYGIMSYEDVEIVGSKVTVDATCLGNAYGIYAYYLLIEDSDVDATVDAGDACDCIALKAYDGIEIVDPLKIVEPEGGLVDNYDSYYTVIDPDDDGNPATHVVIKGPGEEEPVARGYWVKIADTANGTVTSSLPGGGEGLEITLTATPDQGASLYEIKALDDAGREIALTETGDGVYTLVMPASDVRVRARFVKDLPFTDVGPDDYFYDAVVYLYENGVTTGTSETTFEPEKTCTRAETVTFLWRALGEPEPAATACPFTDVAPDAYYYKAVLWAYENGITLGTSETTFSPDDNVLRSMTMTFLYRAVKLQGGGFTGAWAFQLQAPDAADVPDWAYESTCWMVMNQIVQGDEAGNILPLAECNRGQIAAMIYRTVV